MSDVTAIYTEPLDLSLIHILFCPGKLFDERRALIMNNELKTTYFNIFALYNFHFPCKNFYPGNMCSIHIYLLKFQIKPIKK